MGLIFEPQRARENGRKSSPMLRLRGKSSLCELGFEPQRAQRARENGRKSLRVLRLRGKSSLGELCELGGNTFILRGKKPSSHDIALWRGETVWWLD
jgi:hypothetical protein